MGENIYFSKLIKISDIKRKCKQLKIGKQERLYGDNDAPPTYPITHKEFPNEMLYIVFNDYSDEGSVAKLGENCDKLEFCEVYRPYGYDDYHILLVLSGTFDIKYANDIRAWATENFSRYILHPDFIEANNAYTPVFNSSNGIIKYNKEMIAFPQLDDVKIDFSKSENLQQIKPMEKSHLTDDDLIEMTKVNINDNLNPFK